MSNEVEVMDAVAAQNYQAAHSVMVMEQWGNGEIYSEERWIERGRQAVRQTMEGMFELGRALIVLKEHTEHGRFRDPEQGDALSLSLGDQFTGLVSFGKFEIVEIEYNHPPSTVSLKALAAGISKASRTLKGRAYENTTLAEIVRQVAARLKLESSGQEKDIKIKRITQYQERDIEFLSRLAKEYGHTFKIVGNKLVFADNATLKEREVVVVLQLFRLHPAVTTFCKMGSGR